MTKSSRHWRVVQHSKIAPFKIVFGHFRSKMNERLWLRTSVLRQSCFWLTASNGKVDHYTDITLLFVDIISSLLFQLCTMSSFSMYGLLSVLIATMLLSVTYGFHVVPSAHKAVSSSSALLATSRREVVSAAAGITTAAILANGVSAAEKGKVVELQVDNLDGEPGKTGTIKIQLRPGTLLRR